MNSHEAIKKLKSFHKGKYVSVEEEVHAATSGKIRFAYAGYVEGYGYKSGLGSFEEVIGHFTRRLILDRTFGTKFITKKCDHAFCDALNKTF